MADNDLDDIDEFNEQASKPLPPKPPLIEWVLYHDISEVRENPSGTTIKVLKKQELPPDSLYLGIKPGKARMGMYCSMGYYMKHGILEGYSL